MVTHPMIEQLIDAQLDFLEQHFVQPATLAKEWQNFYQWLSKQQLSTLWSFEHIHALLSQQILNTPASDALIQHIAEQLRFALIHPCNEQAKIADVLSVFAIDKTAQYVASKAAHRQKLVNSVVNHPAFSSMLSQLIQHAIQDYLDHSMVKHVPGVASVMKLGKSVLESVTDNNLDDTITQYLQRNILKFSQMSESVLNQYFDDDTLYHFQASLWHKVKDQPLSVLRHYIEVQDLPQTVGLAAEFWDYMRQSEYAKQQLHDGLYAWYSRNQTQRFDALLLQLNINSQLVEQQLQALLDPLIQQLMRDGYFRGRARGYLQQFYYQESTLKILNLS